MLILAKLMGMVNKASLVLLIAITLAFNAVAQVSEQSANGPSFLPKLDGSLKTKLETDLEKNKMRFEVRNARFGATGSVNKYFGYRAEIDLSDEGRVRMLDAHIKVTPIQNLDLYLGQRKVPFGTDYLRSPVTSIFANRSFVAKYVNDGLRDIGFVANYRVKLIVPLDIWLGAMNGTGNNNPQWIERPNYSARLTMEPMKNFRMAGNYYHGSTLLENKLTMYGGELRYQTSRFLIESEYIHRHFVDTANIDQKQYGFYIHSYYNILTGWKMIQIVSPVVRYDFMGNDALINENLAERITAGINFGFHSKQFVAEIRLNYENYIKKYYLTHFDKFTIEFIAKF
jgi:hypothetical protein